MNTSHERQCEGAACSPAAPNECSPLQQPKVIIITGPTGVGKTAVGLLLAEQLGGEVVSADSVQVYRGLDVGSDKLPLAERRGIPHHLLDVCDLTEEYSAGQFHDQGRAAIQDILARGKLPVVVGGTGFYLRLLVEGKPAAAKAGPELEQQVDDAIKQAWATAAAAAGLPGGADGLSKEARWEAAVALLGQLGDQEAMHRIAGELNNYYRLQRAMAILMSNPGKTLRELDVGTTGTSAADYDFRTFFMFRPRTSLYKKVDVRLQEMVLGGLLDEACMLLEQGLLPGTSMATRAVGYHQSMTWLLQAALNVQECGQVKVQLQQLVLAIAVATHRLIRNQMTWFRDRHEYKWLNMDELHTAEAAAQVILKSVLEQEHKGEVMEGNGYLPAQEKKDHASREVQYTVLEARQAEAQQLLKYMQEVLAPRLLSSPAVAPALQAERAQQVQRQKEAREQAELKERKKQERIAARQKKRRKGSSSGDEQTAQEAGVVAQG